MTERGAPLDDDVFEIHDGGASYLLYLPDHATDHIQGGVARERIPYERAMLQDMARRLQPNQVVVDVGANVGNHTIYLARVVGAAVWAFEPGRALAVCLRRSAELNGVADRVHVHERAVGSVTSHGRLVVDDPSNLGGGHVEVSEGGDGAVEVVSLDEADLPSNVRAIKIDVEGMELDVLRGASQVIERSRPLLYVESLTSAELEGVSEWLRARGYVYWATFNHSPTNLYVHAAEVTADGWHARLDDSARSEYAHRATVAALRSQLASESERAASLSARVDALQAACQELKAELEVVAKHRDRARAEVAGIRASTTFRLGASLRDAARRPRAAVMLPVTWARLLRDRRRR